MNWGGVAADPERGIVYAHAHDTSLVGWIEEKQPGKNYGRGTQGSTIPYDRGSVDGAGPYFSFSAPLVDEDGKNVATLPCYRPPWSRLMAIDANTGETVWQSTLGITPELPLERQMTGGSGSAGPTATAGGISSSAQPTTDAFARSTPLGAGAVVRAARESGQRESHDLSRQQRASNMSPSSRATRCWRSRWLMATERATSSRRARFGLAAKT